MLRRHPRLTLAIDGHEASHEGVVHETEDGSSVRASFGQSQLRADVVKSALLEIECLTGLSRLGAKIWGKLPSRRFGERITCRGWEDSVAEAAGWEGGLETCHAECYFTLDVMKDSVCVPSRPIFYQMAAETLERNALAEAQHFDF